MRFDDSLPQKQQDKHSTLGGRVDELLSFLFGELVAQQFIQQTGAISPEYTSKSGQGFSADVGVCISSLLGVSEFELLCLTPSFAFTWLGKLHNVALANSMRTEGLNPRPRSFGIEFGIPINAKF